MYLISTIQKPPESYWLRGLAFIDCAEAEMQPLGRVPLLLDSGAKGL